MDESPDGAKTTHIPAQPPNALTQSDRTQPSHVQLLVDRTVEDDFLERLTEDRDLSSGPYSNPPKPLPRRSRNHITPAGSHRRSRASREALQYEELEQDDMLPSRSERPMRSQLSSWYNRQPQKSTIDDNNPRIRKHQVETDTGLFDGFFSQFANGKHGERTPQTGSKIRHIKVKPAVADANTAQSTSEGTNYSALQTSEEAPEPKAEAQDTSHPPRTFVPKSSPSVAYPTFTLKKHKPMTRPPERQLAFMFHAKRRSRDTKYSHRFHSDVASLKERLVKQLDSNAPAQDTHATFLQLHSNQASLSVAIWSKLCRSLINAWSFRMNEEIPSPSKFLQQLEGGKAPYTEVWGFAIRIVLAITLDRTTNVQDTNQHTLPAHLREIVGLWSQIFQHHGECYLRNDFGTIEQVVGITNLSVCLRSEQMKRLKIQKCQFKEDSTVDLGIANFLTLREGNRHSGPDIDAFALISWLLLRENCETFRAEADGDEIRTMDHFMELMTNLPSLPAYANDKKLVLHSRLAEKTRRRSKDYLLRKVQEFSSDEKASIPNFPDVRPQPAQPVPFEERIITKIDNAIQKSNIRRLEEIWRVARHTFSGPLNDSAQSDTRKPSIATGAPITSRVFQHFFMAYMALQRPTRAIEVWNTMIYNGHKPELAHWDALLNGCGLARDLDGVFRMWQKALESNIKPDVKLWTTRIHSLMSCKRPDLGIAAFQEMALNWVNKAIASGQKNYHALGDLQDTPKPNTRCLNTAVGGLVTARKFEDLVRLISWSRKLGIKPDSYTFNPLIRTALKDKDFQLALKALQQMQASGIEPDVATFTLVLDMAVRHDGFSSADDIKNALAPLVSRSSDSSVRVADSNSAQAHGTIDPADNTTVGNSDDSTQSSHTLSADSPIPFHDDRDISLLSTLADPPNSEPTDSSDPGFFNAQSFSSKNKSALATLIQTMLTNPALKPSPHTYTTLIAGLLHSNPPNPEVAHALLSYISTHQPHALSSQLYTSLISFHFAQDPPELESVKWLWRQAKRKDAKVDTRFFERVVDGWIGIGNSSARWRMQEPKAVGASHALEAWQAARQKGWALGFDTLRRLLTGLLRSRMYDEAAHFVDGVREQERSPSARQTKRAGKVRESFWRLVEQAGLDDEGSSVAPFEQAYAREDGMGGLHVHKGPKVAEAVQSASG